MKLKLFSHLPLALFLVACASGHKETSTEIRKLVMANKHGEAIKVLKKSSLSKDAKSKLLFEVELGLLEHYKGNYVGSIEALNKAKVLIDELYTTRVSGKISSTFSNDNADLYYGEKYEASLVYFYLSLNHYMKANLEVDPEKKKVALLEARSEVLAWDSFLTEIKNERLGKALFKEDLLAKTFGALVHESQGTRVDDQIALQLYKDASSVYFKNYNLFPTFNGNYKEFRSNYDDLPKLPEKEVAGKYVLATKHSSPLMDFLTTKVLSLTKKIRPQDYKAQLEKLKPSEEVLKKLSQGNANMTFLVQDGLIAEKVAKKYEFPFHVGPNAGAFTFGYGNRIEFELPYVEATPELELARLEALDASGNVIAKAPLSVIAPLGDLAEQAINEHSAAVAAKTGARVAGKHLAALLATQASYNATKDRNPTIALMIATVGHATAVAAINKSEKADVRFWSTLPSNIRMGNLSLPAGSYKFRAVFGEEGAPEYRVLELGEQTVAQETLRFAMSNKNLKYRGKEIAEQKPVLVQPDENNPVPTITSMKTVPTPPTGCHKDNECPQGYVCATVRGEYPGSCAATGLLGGVGRNPTAEKK